MKPTDFEACYCCLNRNICSRKSTNLKNTNRRNRPLPNPGIIQVYDGGNEETHENSLRTASVQAEIKNGPLSKHWPALFCVLFQYDSRIVKHVKATEKTS